MEEKGCESVRMGPVFCTNFPLPAPGARLSPDAPDWNAKPHACLGRALICTACSSRPPRGFECRGLEMEALFNQQVGSELGPERGGKTRLISSPSVALVSGSGWVLQ